MKAMGYIRCSTAEQASGGLSLEVQRSRITAWCEAAGADLVELVEDSGISGTKALAERPGGARVAALLASRIPDVDTVVVARLDRLGRDAAETLALLRAFSKGAVGLVSIADRIDLGTPQGRAMAQMSAVFGELERSLIAQRTADALAQLRSNRRAYGPTPFGFKRLGDHLVPDPEEQKIVTRLKRLRARGLSYARIAASLNRARIPAKRGGVWHAMSVRSVLLTAEKLGGLNTEAA